MSVNVWDAPIQEVRGETQVINVAGTTTNYHGIQPGFREVKFVCDTAWALSLAPKLLHCLYYTVAGGYIADYVKDMTDCGASHMHINAMLNTSYIYLCTTDPVLGFYYDITDANAEAATLDVEYCSTAMSSTATIAFTDVAADSDQTDAAGATLGVDGEYVFTYVEVPRSRLGTYQNQLYSKGCWYRFKPSATLTNPTSIANIIPIYKDATNLCPMSAGVEYTVALDTSQVGGYYAQCSGAKNLFVGWIR
jgi:hypothetical protein